MITNLKLFSIIYFAMRVELQKLNTTVNDIQFLKIFAISINIYVKFSHVKKVTLTFDDMRKFSNNKEWHISAFFLLISI